MNILIVTENFAGGGLETHIHSYYMQLRDRHRFTFAIGSITSKLEFRPDDLALGFHFKRDSSVAEFAEDVNALVALIRERRIDVIHAHPFYSLFPAVIASQITAVPIVCTYHGIASFSFSDRLNDTILYQYAYEELMSKIFTVSDVGKRAISSRMNISNAVFLPNGVDVALYRQHRVQPNRKWAVISRLDGDNGKETALRKLFELLPSLDMAAVDIYGDGTRRAALEDYAQSLGLQDKVSFMGFQSDLYERIDNGYAGVIGTDRVAIEGLTMGYPVLELGYGRINGIFDEALLKAACENNFDANLLPDRGSSEELNRQLARVYADPAAYNFRPYMAEHFDIARIAERYIQELTGLCFSPHANVTEFFRELAEGAPRGENFYTSQTVFALMRKYIEYYAVIPSVKLLFLLGGECIDLRNTIAYLQDHGGLAPQQPQPCPPPQSLWVHLREIGRIILRKIRGK